MTSPALEFLFIVALPIVLAAGAVVSLLLIGALFYVLDHRDEVAAQVEAAFRRPLRPARPTGAHHYYKPYWRDGSSSPPGSRAA